MLIGTMLGGCSDIYFDRRDSIAFHAGDAPASNVAVQTIDPWPPAAEKRRLQTNGELMQKAAERYRTNKTTPLRPIGTSSVQPGAASAPASTPGSP
ncbi:MAG TPA: hypothetical protein VEK73_04145 [Xanthobacteraceae bacterium]|nr:hypothetical protein [Xanthobacteraceae bacterium]